jgi:hypothetical protein
MKKARPVSSLREEAIYRPIFAKYLAEIDRMHEQMKADDVEIAANFAKTDALIAKMKAMQVEDEQHWKNHQQHR